MLSLRFSLFLLLFLAPGTETKGKNEERRTKIEKGELIRCWCKHQMLRFRSSIFLLLFLAPGTETKGKIEERRTKIEKGELIRCWGKHQMLRFALLFSFFFF